MTYSLPDSKDYIKEIKKMLREGDASKSIHKPHSVASAGVPAHEHPNKADHIHMHTHGSKWAKKKSPFTNGRTYILN